MAEPHTTSRVYWIVRRVGRDLYDTDPCSNQLGDRPYAYPFASREAAMVHVRQYQSSHAWTIVRVTNKTTHTKKTKRLTRAELERVVGELIVQVKQAAERERAECLEICKDVRALGSHNTWPADEIAARIRSRA